MSKHKIYIGKSSISKVRLGDARSTDYSYDATTKTLTIYWQGEEVASWENAVVGDAFIVTCDGGAPKLDKMHFPKKPDDFLMYILGFGNGMRCHDWDSYNEALEIQRKAKLINGRKEYEFSTEDDRYVFSFCEDHKGRIFHLAAIIPQQLTAEEYAIILAEWPYPIRYPKTFLREAMIRRFGIDKKQVEKIISSWDE